MIICSHGATAETEIWRRPSPAGDVRTAMCMQRSVSYWRASFCARSAAAGSPAPPQPGASPPPARLDDYKYVSTKYQASSVAPCRIPSAAHLCMQRHLRLNNQHAYDEFDCASQKLCTWRGAGRTLERKGSNASPGRVLTISTRHTCSPSHGNVQHQALLNVLHTPVNL
jgi:hypothetical protein